MFSVALTDQEEPARLVIGALHQVSRELMVLGEYVELRRHSEAPMDESFIATMVNGLAERARVAAEVQSRLDAANDSKREVAT